MKKHEHKKFVERVTTLEKVLSSAPVDRTAALVTQQSKADLSDDERREHLVRKCNAMKDEIMRLPKLHPRRKKLGHEYHVLCAEISALRKKFKGTRSFQDRLLDIIKKSVTKFQWDRWVEEAYASERVKRRIRLDDE